MQSKEKTAINGEWKQGPGYDLFKACEKEISKIQIIAEDLGIITDSVKELKEKNAEIIRLKNEILYLQSQIKN